jgi:predicted glycoside hydrolase/deacetylase ChbG (UPF0249 family)
MASAPSLGRLQSEAPGHAPSGALPIVSPAAGPGIGPKYRIRGKRLSKWRTRSRKLREPSRPCPCNPSLVGGEAALIVSADDYGYRPSYDRGIVEAAAAGAVDAVSVLVARDGCQPATLVATGVEIGLHLELSEPVRGGGSSGGGSAVAALRQQLERFERLFGRPAAFLDGHHHCHAAPGVAEMVAREAARRSLAVRSIDAAHRRLLRTYAVATPDRLVGRLAETADALPQELRAAVEGGELPAGLTEWMVHPGYPDPESGSAYDAGRGEDLELVLGLARAPGLAAARVTHRGVLG